MTILRGGGLVLAILLGARLGGGETARPQLLFYDDFSGLPPGMLSSDVVGAHAEYHYLKATAPHGNWVVSTFLSEASQRAWRLVEEDGRRRIAQTYAAPAEERRRTHPLIVAGDALWVDYTLETTLTLASDEVASGVAVRYRHDRAFYFAGIVGRNAVLRKVEGGAGFRVLRETTLAEAPVAWRNGEPLSLRVSATGEALVLRIGAGLVLRARDASFRSGRIALLSDVPARFGPVRVTCTRAEASRFGAARAQRERREQRLLAENPRMVLWRRLETPGFGVDRSLRFGDLDGDGRIDLLFGQVVHHGPKDRASELGCLTALTLDGRVLWQSGLPDPWKHALTNDVAFQIHDLDGDGKAEVVYCRNQELVVAEGRTGRPLRKIATPLTPPGERPDRRFERILGDSLLFADLRGLGAARDLILKDRYWHVWAMTDALEPLWDRALNTGHYPYAADVDGDGNDELAIGYSLVDHDGRLLFSLDQQLQDHSDGVAIVPFREGAPPRILNAASDEGLFVTDLRGRILTHHYLGHAQNPSVADYRPDLPGLETVAIDFWGNQGIVTFLDADGRVYHESEPAQHGSPMLPVNWTGRPGEYWVLSANPVEGGLFDGWGRRVVRFPADGHPDLAYAVLDLFGDARDEVVVWDPWELWIYTQSDNPRPGRLYKPRRNPLYNASNYQATVSLPGWSEP